MARGLIYGGLRLGLYTPIKSLMGTSQKNDAWAFYKKVAAGMTSGGLAAAITNPTELARHPHAPAFVLLVPYGVLQHVVVMCVRK